MRERIGQIFENKKTGNWVARVAYKNTNGKKTAIQQTAKNKEDAKKILRKLIEKLSDGGRKRIDAEKLTFNDLADYYEMRRSSFSGHKTLSAPLFNFQLLFKLQRTFVTQT